MSRLGAWWCHVLHNRRVMEDWSGYYCLTCCKRRDSRLKVADSGYVDRLEAAGR